MPPSSSNSYGESEYWDERYKKEGPNVVFDWYQKYSAISPFIHKYLSKSTKVLVSGCGNSALSADMAADGYQEIWSIDISQVVIDGMKEKHSENERLKYGKMDARYLDFESNSFDGVIDKGTLDALLCGDNSTENAEMMLGETARVLKPGGVYIQITYGDPRSRMHHLENPALPWTIQMHIIPRPGEDIPLCEGKTAEDNPKYLLEPVQVEGNRMKPSGISLDSGNVHYVYICTKTDAP